MNGNAKGSALLEPVKILRLHRERSLEALPPELQHYLHDRILVSSWYPESDYIQLIRALAKVMKTTYERIGSMSARIDLNGIYAKLMTRRRVEDIATIAPVLWRNYHDTGREAVTFIGRLCSFEIKEFALVDADYCKVVGAYNRELIEIAGGVVLAKRKVTCTAQGDRSCVWEFDWASGQEEGRGEER